MTASTSVKRLDTLVFQRGHLQAGTIHAPAILPQLLFRLHHSRDYEPVDTSQSRLYVLPLGWGDVVVPNLRSRQASATPRPRGTIFALAAVHEDSDV